MSSSTEPTPGPKKGDAFDFDYGSLQAITLITCVGAALLIVYAGYAGSFAKSVSDFAVIFAVALASLMLGGLGGFLFAIPRRLQDNVAAPAVDPNSATPRERTRSLYSANTNLEQISDWLTKIIVGIGLIEFRNISDRIAAIGGEISKSLGTPNQVAFPVAIIIFFTICGFLIGYLWARLILAELWTKPSALMNCRKPSTS